MEKIDNNLSINTSPEKLYQAIISKKGLSAWWTTDCDSLPEIGGRAEFRFNDGQIIFSFEYKELIKNEKVRLVCVDNKNSPAWQDTSLTYEIKKIGDNVELNFSHSNWKEKGKTYNECVGGWNRIILII